MSIVRYFPTLKKVYQHTMEGKRAEVNGTINNQMDKLFSTGHESLDSIRSIQPADKALCFFASDLPYYSRIDDIGDDDIHNIRYGLRPHDAHHAEQRIHQE